MKLIGTRREVPEVRSALPVSCLRDGLKLDITYFEKQVQKLPREETLAMCCKLNLIFAEAMYKSVPGYQHTILKRLCHHQWVDDAEFEKMAQYAERRKETLDDNVFFSRITCLELIRWVSVWANSSNTGQLNNDMNRKHGFSRSMLMAFELWSSRTQLRLWQNDEYDSLPSESQQFESLRIFREASLWQVPTFNPLWNLGRANELFLSRFFGRIPEVQRTIEDQLNMSLEDYIACVIGLMSLKEEWFGDDRTNIVGNFEFNPLKVCENAPHMQPVVETFLRAEAQNSEQLLAAYKKQAPKPNELTNLLPLRERPILLIDGIERATIIDQAFLAERASNGLLFKAARIIGDEAMRHFGDAFEEYAMQRFDRYVKTLRDNGHSVQTYSALRAKSKATGEDGEFADYLIQCGRRLIVIEIKGKWLQDRAIASLTAEEYWKEIREKYVLDTSSAKEKRKGVSQLGACAFNLSAI